VHGGVGAQQRHESVEIAALKGRGVAFRHLLIEVRGGGPFGLAPISGAEGAARPLQLAVGGLRRRGEGRSHL
jgi:hypothetical protein